ncbi:MAG: hypothetical protein R3A45_08190 [Bdellovibrionota bacterium]
MDNLVKAIGMVQVNQLKLEMMKIGEDVAIGRQSFHAIKVGHCTAGVETIKVNLA